MPNTRPTRRFLSAARFSPEHRRRYRPKINAITASREGSQSEALLTTKNFFNLELKINRQ
jgi:hypothetical protein